MSSETLSPSIRPFRRFKDQHVPSPHNGHYQDIGIFVRQIVNFIETGGSKVNSFYRVQSAAVEIRNLSLSTMSGLLEYSLKLLGWSPKAAMHTHSSQKV
ncbi:hypothetical protein HYFRA_00013939 [Hymenoscyphus fraxineus]|uniref:Uncharacterized protein n=1 Tax=Hymenoscyphus fraxineus TaxID=746836 RepID=A0A9N9Q186_9HELO|nr:hypothetical protein HYFRA_00013939 [Hymenoscyphus fraxineus]